MVKALSPDRPLQLRGEFTKRHALRYHLPAGRLVLYNSVLSFKPPCHTVQSRGRALREHHDILIPMKDRRITVHFTDTVDFSSGHDERKRRSRGGTFNALRNVDRNLRPDPSVGFIPLRNERGNVSHDDDICLTCELVGGARRNLRSSR